MCMQGFPSIGDLHSTVPVPKAKWFEYAGERSGRFQVCCSFLLLSQLDMYACYVLQLYHKLLGLEQSAEDALTCRACRSARTIEFEKSNAVLQLLCSMVKCTQLLPSTMQGCI